MTEFHEVVLKRLAKGPAWIRSLGPYKRFADQLCEHGYVERIRPEGGAARNMMALTDKGRQRVKAS